MTVRRTGPLALAAFAALATVALTACGSDHPLAPTAASVAPAASTGTPGVAGPDGVAAGVAGGAAAGVAAGVRPGTGSVGTRPGGSGSGSGPGSGSANAGGSGSAPGSGGGRSTPAPAIAGLRVISAPTCPVHGTPDAPFSSPGTPVTIAWSVTGADGAAIAVDNPGLYGAYGSSYPAKGQLELPFGCDATGTTTHTFTVWPAGATSTSKTLSVSALSDG